jgi:hypothetical protein
VNVLFDAYFNDTLEHSKCNACAVGNICREASFATGIVNYSWAALFITSPMAGGYQWNYIDRGGQTAFSSIKGIDKADAFTLISATGYTPCELAEIEFAFECAPQGESKEDYMYNGLVAVLDVLKEIHEVTDEDSHVSKQRFSKHHASKVSI